MPLSGSKILRPSIDHEVKSLHITSKYQWDNLVERGITLVVKFYADWCTICALIYDDYQAYSNEFTRKTQNVIFTHVNIQNRKDIAERYDIRTIPTVAIIKNNEVTEAVSGNQHTRLRNMMKKLATEQGFKATKETEDGNDVHWLAASPPSGYINLTHQVDLKGVELHNYDRKFGDARTLFDKSAPISLKSAQGKGKKKAEVKDQGKSKDWVESDVDQQMMLYIPCMSMLKVGSIHITSLPPKEKDARMRPKIIRIYSNHAYAMNFEQTEDVPEVQSVELGPGDWDAETGTAVINLRFVKFQNVTSLTIFVVEGSEASDPGNVAPRARRNEDENESDDQDEDEDEDDRKGPFDTRETDDDDDDDDNDAGSEVSEDSAKEGTVRIDRIRLIGQIGEKRDGKIEKIIDE